MHAHTRICIYRSFYRYLLRSDKDVSTKESMLAKDPSIYQQLYTDQTRTYPDNLVSTNTILLFFLMLILN